MLCKIDREGVPQVGERRRRTRINSNPTAARSQPTPTRRAEEVSTPSQPTSTTRRIIERMPALQTTTPCHQTRTRADASVQPNPIPMSEVGIASNTGAALSQDPLRGQPLSRAPNHRPTRYPATNPPGASTVAPTTARRSLSARSLLPSLGPDSIRQKEEETAPDEARDQQHRHDGRSAHRSSSACAAVAVITATPLSPPGLARSTAAKAARTPSSKPFFHVGLTSATPIVMPSPLAMGRSRS